MNVIRAPFSCRVKNATDNFYECMGYIKKCALQPLYAVSGDTVPVVVTRNGDPVWLLAPELLHTLTRAKRMVLVLFTVLAVTVSVSASPAQKKDREAKQPAKQEQKDKSASMTGCVDEQEGRYVLVDDHSLARIADLEADGFPNEGFAKHMGHKVTVRGISTTNGTRPLFKVRTVETL